MLLPDITELAEALKHGTLTKVAAEFGVTMGVVLDRLDAVTRAERPVVRDIMSHGLPDDATARARKVMAVLVVP